MAGTEGTDPRIGRALARNWGWLAALGVLLIAMGTMAILAPVLSSIAVNAWIGIAFIVAGAAQGAHAWSQREWAGTVGHAAIGAIYVIGGVMVLFNPLASLMAFSLLVAAMLVVSGGLRLWEGIRMKPEDGWGWMTAAGAAMLAAAFAIWAAFPGAAFWLLGLIAGIAFVSEGWALLILGLAARRASRR